MREEDRLNSTKIREQQQEAVGFTTRHEGNNGDLSVGRGGSHDDFTSQACRTKDKIELVRIVVERVMKSLHAGS